MVLWLPKFIPRSPSYLGHLERLPLHSLHTKHSIPLCTSVLLQVKFSQEANELITVRNSSPIFWSETHWKTSLYVCFFFISVIKWFLKLILLFSTAGITGFGLSFRWKSSFLTFHHLPWQILCVPEVVILTLDQNLIFPAFLKPFSQVLSLVNYILFFALE